MRYIAASSLLLLFGFLYLTGTHSLGGVALQKTRDTAKALTPANKSAQVANSTQNSSSPVQAALPEGAKPEGASPAGATSEGAKPERASPEGAKPEGAKPEGASNGEPAGGIIFPADFVKSMHKANTITYVNFWAEWCLPCKEELPLLEKWAQKLKNSKRRIVLLHLDNTEFGHEADKQIAARQMQKKLAPSLISLWAPKYHTTPIQAQQVNKIPLNQLPYHLIINSQGQVAHHWGGALIDKVDIQAAHTKLWGTH